MVTEEVLHEDSDGKKVILHVEFDDAGVEKKRWVTYERYPDVKYGYLSAVEAAEKILKGEEIKRFYIEALTVDALNDAEEKLKTGQFAKEGEIEIDDKKRTGPILERPIYCIGCLIGRIDFSKLVINADFKTFQKGSERNFVHIFGEAQFEDVIFRGKVEFIDTIFSIKAFFSYVTFSYKTLFWSSIFRSDVDFWRATFRSDVDFMGATFCGKADFMAATFKGNVYFYEVYMLEGHFLEARFEKLLNMSEITVGRVSFYKAVIVENVFLSCDWRKTKLIYCHKRTRKAIDSNERMFDKNEKNKLLEDWRNSEREIYGVDFNNTFIQGELKCDFETLSPKKMRRIEPIIEPHKYKAWSDAQKQYSWLKEQYRKQGAYEDEDKAHWWAMDCRMKNSPVHSWFYRNVLGYGVRPLNVLLTIGFVLLFFWGIFIIANFTDHILPNQSGNNPLTITERIWDSLYFSVITFATVGYGDIQPVGWAKGFAMLEGLLGIVLNAALVVVMFRKLIR